MGEEALELFVERLKGELPDLEVSGEYFNPGKWWEPSYFITLKSSIHWFTLWLGSLEGEDQLVALFKEEALRLQEAQWTLNT